MSLLPKVIVYPSILNHPLIGDIATKYHDFNFGINICTNPCIEKRIQESAANSKMHNGMITIHKEQLIIYLGDFFFIQSRFSLFN